MHNRGGKDGACSVSTRGCGIKGCGIKGCGVNFHLATVQNHLHCPTAEDFAACAILLGTPYLTDYVVVETMGLQKEIELMKPCFGRGGVFNHSLSRLQILHRVAHGFQERGVHLREFGQDVVPYAITAVGGVGVGAIGAPWLADGLKEGYDFVARGVKQRADNRAVERFYARKSLKTSAAGEVEKESFDSVVEVMSHGDKVAMVKHALLFEPGIAEFAGSHLDGELMGGGIAQSIEIGGDKGEVQLLGKVAHKALILIGFRTTEMEIAMRHNAIVTRTDKQAKQTYGICTAAHANQKLALGLYVG